MISLKKYKLKKEDDSSNKGKVCNNKKGVRNIFLEDLDELNVINDDLKTLTFLKLLVEENFESGYTTNIFPSQSKGIVDAYLLELQIDKIKKLENLMEKMCQ